VAAGQSTGAGGQVEAESRRKNVRATVIREPGGADVLTLGEAPNPTVGDDEVLVRVHAAGVNRADILQRTGNYNPPPGASSILGLELAGEVASAAANWRIGDRVMAVVTGGGYAEFASVPASMLMPIPEKLSYEQAAAIPEAFLTAYLNLFWLGKLQAGQSVLIHAGGSGVGTAAIQLARVAGARVLVTAGAADKLQRCRELGADVTINYKVESFADRVLEATGGAGVNLVLDFIGAPYWNDNLRVLSRGGRLAIIGLLGGTRADLDVGAILRQSLTVTGTTLRPMPLEQKSILTQEFVEFALQHFDNGELVPVLDTIFMLAEAANAHRMMEANRNTGKIVLRI
jgi:putative PIG3 family NAD(P)H quinone oxidoreductase